MNEHADSNTAGELRTILIVDDETDIVTTYTMLFEHYGFRVLVANNGKDALELAVKNRPDVVLSDYMMPMMNGADLCSRLKSDPRFSQVLFFLTSAAPPKDLQVPCDLFLQKPVSFERLLKEIKLRLENRQRS